MYWILPKIGYSYRLFNITIIGIALLVIFGFFEKKKKEGARERESVKNSVYTCVIKTISF